MTITSVEHALAGRIPAGGEVTVRGWVRTRRDSKAGLSFVNVSDEEVQSILDRLKASQGTDEYHLKEIYLTATPDREGSASVDRGR